VALRFCSLGSGSGGNATVVEASSGVGFSRVLVDAGFSLRELDVRLARAGLAADQIDAVFVTHEHGDHIGCAVALARRQRIPLWTSRGTWRAIGGDAADEPASFARDGESIVVGALRLQPFTVPHDAAEPLQLRCDDGAAAIGILTDVGASTPHLLANLQGCHALLLECNHDREMLAQSRYPASLKARIGGRLGHLANDTAAEILAGCLHGGLGRLVAAHLSEQNNRPDLARRCLAQASGRSDDDVVVADPRTGTGWIDVG
jgi:phosphoribosyl 1,2-cyclic phosphodiesterase